MTSAEILADSIGENGVRVTTFLCTAPRFILAEVNTHKMVSKSSGSSRAKPLDRRLKEMEEGYYWAPSAFGKNKRGMSSEEALSEEDNAMAAETWALHREYSMRTAHGLGELKAHKQWAARPLELHSWHTMILTATDWQNFFNLRTDKNAQPEFQELAKLMLAVYEMSTPQRLLPGAWHLPFCTKPEELEQLPSHLIPYDRAMISAGRCTTISYDNLGKGVDWEADLRRASMLINNGHMSPFEHQAQCLHPLLMSSSNDKWLKSFLLTSKGVEKNISTNSDGDNIVNMDNIDTSDCYWGNLRGWGQLRKQFYGEAVWHPSEVEQV